jgi:hypothetical protein
MFVKATHPLRTQARRREAATRKVVFTLTFARECQVFTQKIGQRRARAMPPVGTVETLADGFSMSAYRGIREVIARRSKTTQLTHMRHFLRARSALDRHPLSPPHIQRK